MSEAVTTAPAAAGLRLRRSAATVLDLLILAPTALLIMLVTGLVESAEAWVMPQPIIRLTALVVGTYLLLNGYLLVRAGQTLGKRMLKVRVVAVSGARAPLWRLLLRAFGIPLLSAPLGLTVLTVVYAANVLLALAPAQRCGHDYLAGCKVVQAQAATRE